MSRTTRARRTTVAALLALLLVALLALPLAGCGTLAAETSGSTESTAAAQAPTENAVFPVTITDDAGREVTIESEPQRIVSLAPANTEIVAELGLIDRLVGVTTFCDYPPEVADIEKVGDFVGPNMEAVTAVEPDVVLATTGVQADVIEQLEAIGAVVIAVDPQTLDGLYASIGMLGDALGTPNAAAETVEKMRAGIETIQAMVAEEPPVPCFIEIAQDPLFTVGSGTLLDDMITAAGGTNIVTEPGYVGYSLEQLLQDDPAVYLATLGSMSDPADLQGRAGYEALTAVKNERVYVLEDNLVSRPGPRIAEGVGQIAVALHPELFK